jgi:hypothetical protein
MPKAHLVQITGWFDIKTRRNLPPKHLFLLCDPRHFAAQNLYAQVAKALPVRPLAEAP